MTPVAMPETATRPIAYGQLWQTIVWDDPVNLMSYVTFVFQTYFGYSHSRAETLMFQVHCEGKAIVSTGSRESMERDVEAMQSYGLWASMETL